MTEAAIRQPAGYSDLLLRRPFVTAAALFMLGIALHRELPHRTGLLLAIAGICVAIALIWRPRSIASLFLSAAILLAGSAAAQLEAFHYASDHIGRFASDSPHLVRLELRIATAPRLLNAGGPRPLPPRQVMQAEALRILTSSGWRSASGTILVQIAEPHEGLSINQRIEAFGVLGHPAETLNPGQFDWAHYYRQRRILTSLHMPHAENVRVVDSPGPGWLDWLRQKARDSLEAGFKPDRAVDRALLRALVLGDPDPQLRDVQEEFMRTGTSHHLAISGAHIAILGGLVYGLCRLLFLHPRRATWIALACVGVYGLVALPSPPVVRSVLLCLAVGIGLLARRTLDMVQLLALSVFAMLVYHPLDLYDAGFQLSFGTALGLMIFTRPGVELVDSLRDRDVLVALQAQRPRGLRRFALDAGGWLRAGLIAGIVAWLTSSPLIAFHFNKLNPWAIPGSLILAAPVGVALTGGLLKIMLTPLLPFAAPVLAWAADQPIALMRWMVELLAKLPGSEMHLPEPSAIRLIACYALLLAPLVPWGQLKRRAAEKIRWPFSLLLIPNSRLFLVSIPACVLLLMPWPVSHSARDPARVALLSVGSGQCAVVHLPSGKTAVIDAGSASAADPAYTFVNPYLKHTGVGRINWLFVSHPNQDHFNAVEHLAVRFGVEQVYLAPTFTSSTGYDAPAAARLLSALKQLGCPTQTVSAGQTIQLDETAKVEVLWPKAGDVDLNENDASLVLRLTCYGRSILFPGDIQDAAQRALLAQQLKCDVLVAPHHGGGEPATADFIKAADPAFILSSNARKLSRKQLALEGMAADRALYRTHRDGAITITIAKDGVVRASTFIAGE